MKRVLAATKTRKILYRGITFTLRVEDDPDHEGHVLARLYADPPSRGLDRLLYEIHRRFA
jgi:hypothetical protein